MKQKKNIIKAKERSWKEGNQLMKKDKDEKKIKYDKMTGTKELSIWNKKWKGNKIRSKLKIHKKYS